MQNDALKVNLAGLWGTDGEGGALREQDSPGRQEKGQRR